MHTNRKAMNYFKEYLIVGGMSQVVEIYSKTKDFEKVDKITSKHNIIPIEVKSGDRYTIIANTRGVSFPFRFWNEKELLFTYLNLLYQGL